MARVCTHEQLVWRGPRQRDAPKQLVSGDWPSIPCRDAPRDRYRSTVVAQGSSRDAKVRWGAAAAIGIVAIQVAKVGGALVALGTDDKLLAGARGARLIADVARAAFSVTGAGDAAAIGCLGELVGAGVALFVGISITTLAPPRDRTYGGDAAGLITAAGDAGVVLHEEAVGALIAGASGPARHTGALPAGAVAVSTGGADRTSSVALARPAALAVVGPQTVEAGIAHLTARAADILFALAGAVCTVCPGCPAGSVAAFAAFAALVIGGGHVEVPRAARPAVIAFGVFLADACAGRLAVAVENVPLADTRGGAGDRAVAALARVLTGRVGVGRPEVARGAGATELAVGVVLAVVANPALKLLRVLAAVGMLVAVAGLAGVLIVRLPPAICFAVVQR